MGRRVDADGRRPRQRVQELGLFRAAAETGRAIRDHPDHSSRSATPTSPAGGYRDLGVERVIIGANRTALDDPSTTLPCMDLYAMIPEARLNRGDGEWRQALGSRGRPSTVSARIVRCTSEVPA